MIDQNNPPAVFAQPDLPRTDSQCTVENHAIRIEKNTQLFFVTIASAIALLLEKSILQQIMKSLLQTNNHLPACYSLDIVFDIFILILVSCLVAQCSGSGLAAVTGCMPSGQLSN